MCIDNLDCACVMCDCLLITGKLFFNHINSMFHIHFISVFFCLTMEKPVEYLVNVPNENTTPYAYNVCNVAKYMNVRTDEQKRRQTVCVRMCFSCWLNSESIKSFFFCSSLLPLSFSFLFGTRKFSVDVCNGVNCKSRLGSRQHGIGNGCGGQVKRCWKNLPTHLSVCQTNNKKCNVTNEFFVVLVEERGIAFCQKSNRLPADHSFLL